MQPGSCLGNKLRNQLDIGIHSCRTRFFSFMREPKGCKQTYVSVETRLFHEPIPRLIPKAHALHRMVSGAFREEHSSTKTFAPGQRRKRAPLNPALRVNDHWCVYVFSSSIGIQRRHTPRIPPPIEFTPLPFGFSGSKGLDTSGGSTDHVFRRARVMGKLVIPCG